MINIRINKMKFPVKLNWLITNKWEIMIKDDKSMKYGQRGSLQSCLISMLNYIDKKKNYKVTITG